MWLVGVDLVQFFVYDARCNHRTMTLSRFRNMISPKYIFGKKSLKHGQTKNTHVCVCPIDVVSLYVQTICNVEWQFHMDFLSQHFTVMRKNTETWIVVVVNPNEIARRGTSTHTNTPTPIVACAFFSNHTSI